VERQFEIEPLASGQHCTNHCSGAGAGQVPIHISKVTAAGSTLVGITVTEMQDVAVGWSVEREALNAPSSTHKARVRAVLQSLPQSRFLAPPDSKESQASGTPSNVSDHGSRRYY
jgi:hypothetical protein